MKVFGTQRPGAADVVTIGNALCGAIAIGVLIATPWATSPEEEGATLRLIALIVLAGGLLDVCDGMVARARGGTPLGPYLDSLADAVTFGVAPVMAVGGLAIRHSAGWEAVVVAVAGLAYVTAALVRLADFDAGRSRDRHFMGMPSPLGAISVLSVGLLALGPLLTAAGILLTAWLMVSGIRYPRGRGLGLIAEALCLGVAVVGLVGLIDVRIPALLAIAGGMIVAPVWSAVIARRGGHANVPEKNPVERAEP